jgi:MEMO1 family protein
MQTLQKEYSGHMEKMIKFVKVQRLMTVTHSLTKVKPLLKLLYFALIILLSMNAYAEEVQPSSLDGAFYSRDKAVLENMISGFIEAADLENIPGDIMAIISPHAGYQYSGAVAGYGFRALKGKEFKTVIVVASSHRHYFKGIAVLDKDAYATPLGKAPIDRELTKKLLFYDEMINYYPRPFFNENSTETQIPFIQYALPEAKIVVVLIGDPSYETCLLLGDALYDTIGEREDIIIVSSTDMSHFSDDKRARSVDKDVIKEIEKFDPKRLFEYLSIMENKDRPCGTSALVSTLIAAEKLGADKIDTLKYATSADISGDHFSVVGYMSAVVYRSQKSGLKEKQAIKNPENEMEKSLLNYAQRKRLLEIARKTIESYVSTGKKPSFREEDKTLNEEMGAFVTLHRKGSLRGCIGNIIGRGPLYVTVSDMAVQAATADPRFKPVAKDELGEIDIEISVLSPLERIYDPDKIIMGKHGVLVKSGFRSGVYLPQVATETGWPRDKFMDSLCAQKAGIPKDSWRTGECEIYIFSAEVFGEK